jgi:DNA-binding NtrC family response regulator
MYMDAHKKTVLIVDDDALVLESMDLLLSMDDGFQCIRAQGSAGAASHLQQAPIDVIVADVILAGNVSGIDICHQAIGNHPAIATVVITADNEVQHADVSPRSVFLRKPFGGEQLLKAIHEALLRVRG